MKCALFSVVLAMGALVGMSVAASPEAPIESHENLNELVGGDRIHLQGPLTIAKGRQDKRRTQVDDGSDPLQYYRKVTI